MSYCIVWSCIASCHVVPCHITSCYIVLYLVLSHDTLWYIMMWYQMTRYMAEIATKITTSHTTLTELLKNNSNTKSTDFSQSGSDMIFFFFLTCHSITSMKIFTCHFLKSTAKIWELNTAINISDGTRRLLWLMIIDRY